MQNWVWRPARSRAGQATISRDRRCLVSGHEMLGLATLNHVQRLEDGSSTRQTGSPHLLCFDDPDRHSRQLGGVGVDLQPLNRGGADGGSSRGKIDASALMLMGWSRSFSASKARYKKTARAAGRVHYSECSDPVEEGVKQRQRRAVRQVVELGLRSRALVKLGSFPFRNKCLWRPLDSPENKADSQAARAGPSLTLER